MKNIKNKHRGFLKIDRFECGAMVVMSMYKYDFKIRRDYSLRDRERMDLDFYAKLEDGTLALKFYIRYANKDPEFMHRGYLL